MTDEGMRRPPRIWEQKLQDLITSSGFGVGSSSSSTSPIVGGPTPGPGGSNESQEPLPIVDPDPTTPRIPSTPSVFPAIGGLSILWPGLDADGIPFPTGTRVQVHLSVTTGFTPDETTLRGLLSAGERIVVTDLTSGTTYFVRFVLVFPDGTVGDASAQQSLTAGFVLSTNIGTGTIEADMVSFDATAIGGIQQFVGTTSPPITGSGTTQLPKNGSTWINTTEGSYYTLTAGAWVKRQWDSDAIAPSAITTLQIATGAITADSAIIASAAIGSANIIDGNITNAKVQSLSADKLTAGTIDASVITVNNLDADKITAGTLSGRTISGGTVTGALLQTRAGGNRIRLEDDVSGPYGTQDAIEFIRDGVSRGILALIPPSSPGAPYTLDSYCDGVSFLKRNGTTGVSVYVAGTLTALTQIVSLSSAQFGSSGGNFAFRVNASGEVFSYGIDDNTTANAANVRIGASAKLLKSTSTQRVKTDIIALDGELVGVDPDKISTELASVNPYDVLAVVPAEFESLADADDHQRILGFVAENVAEVFPWAAEWDEEGLPSSVADRPILAALLTVVKEQQATIEDLTTRIEALEAN